MAIDVAKTIVEKYEDKDVLECVDSFLRVAERHLKPQDGPYSEAQHGMAYAKIQDARSLLTAYRNKKYSSDPNIVI